MPTISISEATFIRLTARVGERKISIEEVIETLLDDSHRRKEAPTRAVGNPNELSYEEWKARFDAFTKEIQNRADQYPNGFAVDDSRESIYGEREDSQS